MTTTNKTTNIFDMTLHQVEAKEKEDTGHIPQDYPVYCPIEDCGWKGIVADCITLKDQESWEMPEYDYYACPVCHEPIEI